MKFRSFVTGAMLSTSVISAGLSSLSVQVVGAAAGQISLFAGDGIQGFAGDGGPAVDAQIDYPVDVAVADNGEVFIADSGNDRVRKVSTAGTISTVATNSDSYCGAVITGSYQGERVLVVRNYNNISIRSESEGGYENQLASITVNSYSGSCDEKGLAMDSAGFIYYSAGNRIWKVPIPLENYEEPQSIAGTGTAGFSGDGGPATSARLNRPGDLALDQSGNLFFVDTANKRVRKIDSNGVITTVAGNGSYSNSWRGTATEIGLGNITDLLLSKDGSIVLKGDSTFGKVTSNGAYCRFALQQDPTGSAPWYGSELSGMAIDGSGSIYLVAPWRHRVFKVEVPTCPPTIEEVLAREGDLEFFNSIYKASTNPSEFSTCDFSYSVVAPNDLAIQEFVSEIGSNLNAFKSDPTLSGPFLNDHVTEMISPSQLESDAQTSVYLRSNRSAPVSQRPTGSPGTRVLGSNVYINDSLITRAIQVCGGGWTGSYMYVLNKRTFWPPTSLGTSPFWGFTSTPTNSRHVTFRLSFNDSVRGLTASNFENIGSQVGCTFTPVARNRASDFSNSFDVLTSCPGTGTVAPRLRTSSITTPMGVKFVSDPYGANIVDILSNPVLTITKFEFDGGVVESTSISGIDCGVLCVGVFNPGTTVSLKATADLGSIFTGWSGACSGTGPCRVKMDSAKTVNAVFVPAASVVVMKVGQGSGSVSSQPAGINCSNSSPSCLSWIRYNTTLTLTATPSRGSRFVGWMGDCTGTAKCALTIYENKVVYPIFERS